MRTVVSLDRWHEFSELLVSLYDIVDCLKTIFSCRKFTPGGYLLGCIGEVIAARVWRVAGND